MSTVSGGLRGLLLLAGLILSPAVLAEVLENQLWRVLVDPATLAVRVEPAGAPAVQVSAGMLRHKVSGLIRRGNRIDWQWDDGRWVLSVDLAQRDLRFSIAANAPSEIEFIHQPASAMGQALIWPLAEGRYVPRGDRVWQEFLIAQGALDTTQDLSLPLWGMEYERFSLHWLLTNPYNNQLRFKANGDALGLSARHRFTSLEPSKPLTFSLFLGAADPLAGARRYKQWLVDKGQYETLRDKLNKTPQAARLIGAPHVYLWGNDLLGPEDVRNWPLLVARLRGSGSLVSDLRAAMDTEVLRSIASETVLNQYQQTALLRSLNRALNTQARKHWQTGATPDMRVLVAGYADVRAQLAAVMTDALSAEPSRWGRTLSRRTIERLQNAGLSRLWLGLGEGWEGGLWHPETVRAAVAAGYLIAPYDSYETALRQGENPDWTTAHLGDRANTECAIVEENGALKSGFQQSGHYTDPRCVRPLLERRIDAIQKVAGFNSWFVDAYAAGMLFDSYRPGAPMTQAQNAAGNVAASRWINEVLQLPGGSEDGNAATAQGVLFAHGMQTPVIGWGDPDMHQPRAADFFVGQWYPPEQPAVFFKPTRLKADYRHVHFVPANRLPLYQAVFHGSVITSHHWLFDNLKLSDVRVENELTQLLYNVPPLYHLSTASLDQRLPLIVRQDRFFRPLHERLATQALTAFAWLSEDRLVQQTAFADGTRLLANFDAAPRNWQGRTLPAYSMTALLPDGSDSQYQVQAAP